MPLDLTKLTDKQIRLLKLTKINNKGEFIEFDEALLEEVETIYATIRDANERLDTISKAVNDGLIYVVRLAETTQKMEGKPGYTPIKGKDYFDGKDYILTPQDLEKISKKVKVPIVEKVIERVEVIKEQPIVTNQIVKEVVKEVVETGEQIVEKINSLPLSEDFQIDAVHIKNLPRPRTGPLFGGMRYLAGTGITINGNVISSTAPSGGAGYQEPTGAVDGINKTYTFVTAPNVIVVDFKQLQRVQADGDINWTGTTTITLSAQIQAPQSHIFGLA